MCTESQFSGKQYRQVLPPDVQVGWVVVSHVAAPTGEGVAKL